MRELRPSQGNRRLVGRRWVSWISADRFLAQVATFVQGIGRGNGGRMVGIGEGGGKVVVLFFLLFFFTIIIIIIIKVFFLLFYIF